MVTSVIPAQRSTALLTTTALSTLGYCDLPAHMPQSALYTNITSNTTSNSTDFSSLFPSGTNLTQVVQQVVSATTRPGGLLGPDAFETLAWLLSQEQLGNGGAAGGLNSNDPSVRQARLLYAVYNEPGLLDEQCTKSVAMSLGALVAWGLVFRALTHLVLHAKVGARGGL